MADTAKNMPRWWVPGPGDATIPALPSTFSQAMKQVFIGQEARIPINLRSAEERAWRDAVAWLEARQAAEEEWPWPTRS